MGVKKLLVINSLISLFLLFLTTGLFGQEEVMSVYHDVINIDDDIVPTRQNLDEISSVDVSQFWINNPNERRFGFIGENYQRLRLKFLSIEKDPSNPLRYSIRGKSKVAKNINSFTGDFIIKNSFYYKSLEYPEGDSGILVGEYHLKEDSTEAHSGEFKGLFATYWYKDSTGVIQYNNRGDVSALYCNNQFLGKWISYSKPLTLVANWGDSRIPQSGGMDIGTSEFA
ncbi:MAG: hypothetical protein AAFP70_10060, partial [Calditrichota bacterium]